MEQNKIGKFIAARRKEHDMTQMQFAEKLRVTNKYLIYIEFNSYLTISGGIFMEKTFLQVRTDAKDKEQASVILEELGTNLSSVVNMLLKQIILTKSIPFEIKIPRLYTSEEQVSEVSASMAMEQMPLDREDIKLLKEYQKTKDKDTIRQQILENYKE